MDGMNFGRALDQLRLGARVYRQGWNGKGMWLAIEDTSRWPDSKMQLFIYMSTADGTLVPWVASQTDILAEDWLIRIERDEPAEPAEPAEPEGLAEWERDLLAKQDADGLLTDAEMRAKVRSGEWTINRYRDALGLPTAPSATTSAQDAGITLNVHLDGKRIYDAVLREAQRYRRRNGPDLV